MRWSRHPSTALDAFIDDELDEGASQQVAAHVTRCRLCRHRVAATIQVRRSLRAMARRLTS